MVTQPGRCAWANGDPLLRVYHDTEWGIPIRDGRALWELLMLEGFQAGLSWLVVLRKRDAFRRAFAQWDPVQVAQFVTDDVDRLMADAGIIRARAKIEATIAGARAYCALTASRQDFATLIWDMAGGTTIRGHGPPMAQTPLSMRVSKALKALGFKFVGPVIVQAWLQAAGIIDDHAPDCPARAQSR